MVDQAARTPPLITTSNDEFDALFYRMHCNKLARIRKVSSGESRSKVLTFIYIFSKGEGDQYQCSYETYTQQ